MHIPKHIPNLFAAMILAALPALAPTSALAAGDAVADRNVDSDKNAASVEQDVEDAASESTDAKSENAKPDGPIEFRTILGKRPITIPEDKVTPAFEEFRETGENPFKGDEDALAEGKKIYDRLCQACHLKGGEGRIGPSLNDENWRHEQTATEVGRFEIVYSGGAGAMQAFSSRLSLDEILKVMAYTDTFRED